MTSLLVDTNWLESCGGCCTARKLCSDISHTYTNYQKLVREFAPVAVVPLMARLSSAVV